MFAKKHMFWIVGSLVCFFIALLGSYQLGLNAKGKKYQSKKISSEEFCYGFITGMMDSTAVRMGFDSDMEAIVLAANTIMVIMAEEPTSFVSTHELGVRHLPERWFSTSKLLARSLKLEDNPFIVTKTDDLKYIPMNLPGTSVLLVVDSDAGLNPKRVKRILKVAKTRNLKISILWNGNTPSDLLQYLADQSGGSYFELRSQLKDGFTCEVKKISES